MAHPPRFFLTVAAFAFLIAGVVVFYLVRAGPPREIGPTEFDGWWKVPDAELERVIDQIAASYSGGTISFAGFSNEEMERQVAECEANPLLFLRNQARQDLAGVIFYFGAGIDGKPQYFEYRSDGNLHLKLQWVEWARLGEHSVQTYHFTQKLYRWEQAEGRTYLHDRFPIPLPLERLVDQTRRPDDRVVPLSSKGEEKQANQALQTTPMTRSVYEKTIEFGHRRRGV